MGMRALFPIAGGLVAFRGVVLGLLVPLGSDLLARRFLGAEPAEARRKPVRENPNASSSSAAGSPGVGTAQELERLVPRRFRRSSLRWSARRTRSSSRRCSRKWRAARWSRRTFPARCGPACPHTGSARARCRVRRGKPPRPRAGPRQDLPYDHLVLALGAVSNYLGNDAIRAHSLDFKSLGDAIRVRNAVIAAFDAADAEPDADKRRARLTFVIAGGGFSGAELAGALNDFRAGDAGGLPASVGGRPARDRGPFARAHPARTERKTGCLRLGAHAGAGSHLPAQHPGEGRPARCT